MRACVCACVRACERACVRACVRVYMFVHACVCVGACVRVHTRVRACKLHVRILVTRLHSQPAKYPPPLVRFTMYADIFCRTTSPNCNISAHALPSSLHHANTSISRAQWTQQQRIHYIPQPVLINGDKIRQLLVADATRLIADDVHHVSLPRRPPVGGHAPPAVSPVIGVVAVTRFARRVVMARQNAQRGNPSPYSVAACLLITGKSTATTVLRRPACR